MKTWQKFLLILGVLIIMAGIFVDVMISLRNNEKEYSTYCMDAVRNELGEYIGNIHMDDSICSKGTCVYIGGVSYEGVDYSYSCKVYNKENVELDLEPLYGDVCEGDECDVPGTPVEIDEPVAVSESKENEALIIVFSPTGHTKEIATYISEINGAELNELIPATIYTTEDLDYTDEESRVFHEFKNIDFRPEIQTEFDLEGYDTIYLGYPIWFARIPNIILTLLDNYDFSGKEIVLFCTSGSSPIEKTLEYFEPYNLNIIGSHRFAQGASKQEVQEWLESL